METNKGIFFSLHTGFNSSGDLHAQQSKNFKTKSKNRQQQNNNVLLYIN